MINELHDLARWIAKGRKPRTADFWIALVTVFFTIPVGILILAIGLLNRVAP